MPHRLVGLLVFAVFADKLGRLTKVYTHVIRLHVRSLSLRVAKEKGDAVL